ncbi:MAG: phosphoribosyltransferase family protein [Candidatus Woesearchaeota archaeon]
MDFAYYQTYIKSNTTNRYDLTPIFSKPEVFSQCITDLLKDVDTSSFDVVIGLEALGFIIGSAIAERTKKGFIPLRKKGKLPYSENELKQEQFVDYTHTEKAFEIHKEAIPKHTKILLVDEWIETGAQITAALNLLKKMECEVVGICTIGFQKNKTVLTKTIAETYTVHSIVDF